MGNWSQNYRDIIFLLQIVGVSLKPPHKSVFTILQNIYPCKNNKLRHITASKLILFFFFFFFLFKLFYFSHICLNDQLQQTCITKTIYYLFHYFQVEHLVLMYSIHLPSKQKISKRCAFDKNIIFPSTLT